MRIIPRICTCFCRALLALLPLIAAAPSIAQSGSAAGQTVVFEQPNLDGIAGNLHVPKAEHQYPTEHIFNLLLWQPNPNQADGELVPSHKNVADKTGFQPSGPLEKQQAAFRDADDVTTVQVDGDTVGVFLQSRDLPNQSPGDKLMVTPEVKFPKENRGYPFAQPGVAMVNSLELQIPVAVDQSRPGNITYVTSDFTFEDRQTKAKISYGVHIFHHAMRATRSPAREQLIKSEVHGFDEPSHAYQVGNQLWPGSRVISVLEGSTLFQDQPWTGWRSFKFAITGHNFTTALQALKQKFPEFSGSENPADYALVAWHLNAELKFATGPAELGWSMRHASITLVPENRLNLAR